MEQVSRSCGPVRVDVLGKIAEAVLAGLIYLYEIHHLMHRALKPANILATSKGEIKIGDFSVSKELEFYIQPAECTYQYMAPERLEAKPHTPKSDVWSFGLTLFELAVGKYPYSLNTDSVSKPQGTLDLSTHIVLEPAPELPEFDGFPLSLRQLIASCLRKDSLQRPTVQELHVCALVSILQFSSNQIGHERIHRSIKAYAR